MPGGSERAERTPRPRLDERAFREVIGHFASGVTIISTRAEGRDFGTTASAVSSLSLDPPMLLICLNRTSETQKAITASGHFVVNILGEDQADVAARFATKDPRKFDTVDERTGRGLPLVADALAQLECRVTETVTGGTHIVFLAEVEGAAAREGTPLAYYRGRFGRFEDETGGDRVRPLDARTANEAIDARCHIEIAVAEAIAGHVGAEDLAELRRHADAAVRAVAGDPPDRAALAAAGRAFHDTFVGLAGNRLLLEFHRRLGTEAIWGEALRGTDRPRDGGPGYLPLLVDACEAGDLARAKQLIRDHATAVRRLAHEALERAGGED